MVTVCGFGNPLLDYIVQIDDIEILCKHNLNEDDAKEVTCQEVEALLEEVKNRYELSCIPGGCVQNTLRIMKWLLREEHKIVMFGAIGMDANGELLKNLVQNSGVETRYEITDHATGLIISLVQKQNRSLVGNIGAAAHYSSKHLDANHNFLNSTDLIYVEAFFLSHGTGTASQLLKYCTENKKKMAFNVCAPYIIQNHTKDVIEYVHYSDIVFGNQREFKALANVIRGDNNVEELVRQLIKNKPGKYIVITNGCESIYCGYAEDKTIEYSVPQLEKSEVVDTTGAGDSFVAGFLAAHLLNRPPVDCLRAGCWMAQQVIKIIGCKPPSDLPKEDFWN